MPTASVRRPVTPVRVQALEDGRLLDRPDRIVTEEPMEIRVYGPGQEPAALAVTMRTPGHDFELATGFCHTEGLLPSVEHLAEVKYCLGGDGEQEYNVVTVGLRAPVDLGPHRRAYVASASCGICGKATLDQVEQDCEPVASGPVVAGSTLLQ